MNDALMIGIVLTLVFGAVVFYLYNRLSMTEKKMGLVEGVLTDLKIMMDAAPFSYDSGSERRGLNEFEPSPEYLNAISGPFPLKEEEVEDGQSAKSERLRILLALEVDADLLQIPRLIHQPLK
jgi:hypothetical protein